jgi:hypothetical protein
MKYPPTKNINENNSSNNSQNQTEKIEIKEEERNNKIPAILVPTPIFYNPMMKNTKNMYGKYQKKKSRPFTERQGDWICKFCKNLNFAFRNECNRCKVPKKVCVESVKQNEETETKNTNNKMKFSNKKIYKYRKNYSNQVTDKDYNMNEKSSEE